MPKPTNYKFEDEPDPKDYKEMEPIPGFHSDLLQDPKHFREDCKLITRAANERWPISYDKRLVLVDRMMLMAKEGKKERHVLSAVRALITMDDKNVDYERGRPDPVPQTNINVLNLGGDPVKELRHQMRATIPILPVGMPVNEKQEDEQSSS